MRRGRVINRVDLEVQNNHPELKVVNLTTLGQDALGESEVEMLGILWNHNDHHDCK